MAEPETPTNDPAVQQVPHPSVPSLENGAAPKQGTIAARFRAQQLARATAQARLHKATPANVGPAPPQTEIPPTEHQSPPITPPPQDGSEPEQQQQPQQEQKPQPEPHPEPQPTPEPAPKPPLDLPATPQPDHKPASELPLTPFDHDSAPEPEPSVTPATAIVQPETQPAEPNRAMDRTTDPVPARHRAADPPADKPDVAPNKRTENRPPTESAADPKQDTRTLPPPPSVTTPATTALHLRVVSDPASPTEFDLPTGHYILGRSDEADLTVRAPSVSRRHALFDVRPHRATIEDVGSTNGTNVNGERIVGIRTLHPRDRIQLGDVTLDVTMAPAP